MKGASDVHGDQLVRYDTWAERLRPVPKRFYCTLDGDSAKPPPPWQPLSLVDLFGAWEASSDAHAVWLANEITGILRTWDTEADGIIGTASGWYVPDLVSRRTANAVNTHLTRAHRDGSIARARRTNGGNPMFLAWRRHPRGSDNAWIAVDVRCQGRSDPARPWLVRPCIDIDSRGSQARLEAHDLAVALQPAMTLTTLRDVLARRGHGQLAAAFLDDPSDGLSHPAAPTVLDQWRKRLTNGDEPPGGHPVFFHDRRLRLATQLRLDVTQVTRSDLATITTEILDHLVEHA
jgi:hypothetical protein